MQGYNEFFGFSESPFGETPDSRFLYFTPCHREILELVVCAIRDRRGFVVITGEVGTGKTSLVYRLLGTLALDKKIRPVLLFHTTLTLNDLLKSILLKIDPKAGELNKRTLVKKLNDHLLQMLDQGRTLVVILDEAQDLSERVLEELGALSVLDPRVLPIFQVVLVGQPPLTQKLNAQSLGGLKQRIGLTREIVPLTEMESRHYIDHRIRVAGGHASEIMTPEVISMICRHAHGIPRVINSLCDHALAQAYMSSEKRIDEEIIRKVIRGAEGKRPGRVIPGFISRGHFKRIFLVSLALLCAGMVTLVVYGFLLQRPDGQSRYELPLISPLDNQPPSRTVEGTTGEKGPAKEKGDPVGKRAEGALTATREEGRLTDVVVLKKGEIIFHLAQKYYGAANETLADLILQANPEISDARRLQINQVIRIPKLTDDLLLAGHSDGSYDIHVGTFWTEALAEDWRRALTFLRKTVEIRPRKVSPKDTWYQVVVGRFKGRDEAVRTLSLLKGRNLLPAFKTER